MCKRLWAYCKRKTVLDRCVNLVYQDFLANDGDKKYLPTLVDFYNILLAQTEKEAKDMALKLELYVKGNFSTFAHHTNVDLNKRIIIYDVQEMGKQLSDIGSLVILESIWQRLLKTENEVFVLGLLRMSFLCSSEIQTVCLEQAISSKTCIKEFVSMEV